MRLAIIGASGATGRRIVKEALERGHEVIALARSPHKIDIDDPKLDIRRADIFDASSLIEGLKGADAVITTVGKVNVFEKINKFSTTSHRNIIEAMHVNNIKRVLVVSSFGVLRKAKGRPGIPRKIYLFVRRNHYGDMYDMELQMLSAGLEATVVRAPALHDRPPKNNWIMTNDGTLPAGRAISRADLATYLVDELESGENKFRITAVADEGMELPPMRELMPPKN
jgi:putative NADH-flavin reductase